MPSQLELRYRPDLDMLTVRWHHDSSLEQLQAEYEQVTAAGLAHGTARWLIDVRRRVTPSDEATAWVTQHWLPAAVAAMAPAPLCLAYLLSPMRQEAIRTNARLGNHVETALAPEQGYRMALFSDEGAAVRWLLQQPRQ